MSIIVIGSPASASSPSSLATTTAQNIIDCASRKVRAVLGTSGSDADLFLEHINEIQLQILRQSRWEFLLSAPKYFMTEPQQTDYWLGTAGSNPVGTVDTGLALTDFDRMKDDSVYDRSAFKLLKRVNERPVSSGLQYASGQSRPGAPAVWRHDPFENQKILSIYPSLESENTYVVVPDTPNTQSSTAGALAARVYFIRITFVDSLGNESTASGTARQFIAANKVAVVKSPTLLLATLTSGIAVTGYKVYASTTQGGEVVQNGGAAINLGTNWTEGGGGLTTGSAAVPSTNAIEPMRGHLIEFRYYKNRPQVENVSDILMIPDVYWDVVCSGVAWLAFMYLKKPDEGQHWHEVYRRGVAEMIRDKNLFPRGADFIGPDKASVQSSYGGWLYRKTEMD